MMTAPISGSQAIKDLYNAAQSGIEWKVEELLANPEVAKQATMALEIEFSTMQPPVSAEIPFAIMNAAINGGHLGIVKRLLDVSDIPSLTDKDVTQIAHSALITPNSEVLKLLLKIPAISDYIKNNNGMFEIHSSLWYAIVNGRQENAMRLIELPEVFNLANPIQGLKNILKFFKSTEISGTDSLSNGFALIEKYLEHIKSQGFDVYASLTEEEAETLQYYSCHKNSDLFSKLFSMLDLSEFDDKPSSTNTTKPLHCSELIRDLYNAAQDGNAERVRELLAIPEVAEQATKALEIEFSAMVPPSSDEVSFAVMNAAIVGGHLDVVKQLLNVPGMASLTHSDLIQISHSAITSPNVEVLNLLLSIPKISEYIEQEGLVYFLPYHNSLWYAIANDCLENANRLMATPVMAEMKNPMDALKDTLRILKTTHPSLEYNNVLFPEYKIELVEKLLNSARKQGLKIDSCLSGHERKLLLHSLPMQNRDNKRQEPECSASRPEVSSKYRCR